MDNQKDSGKTNIDSYGHSNVPSIKSLVNKPIYKYVTKKTEKIVTALYMVTEFMGTNDAIKNRIRNMAVDLLSDMYKLSTISAIDNQAHISSSLLQIAEIMSLVDIANTIGFISEMNTNILKRELDILAHELEPNQTENTPFSFALDNKMFEVELPRISENLLTNRSFKGGNVSIKDKRTSYGVSFTNGNSLSFSKKPSNTLHAMSKEDRAKSILAIIKDKKEVSIKDISSVLKDYSEKTIQRELNSLVASGQIKKTGAKRWSRYQSLG